MEWVEDVLPNLKDILELIKVYDSVYTSLFTYDYDDNVLHAFWELRRPSTNTLYTFIEEMSISLWDFQDIAVVPSTKELKQADTQNDLLLPQSCRYLFLSSYRLAKYDLQEMSFHDWKVNHVRASIFKFVRFMSHGKKFSLEVLVLGSIYSSLREISTSSNLSVKNIIFPIHYLYGWLGEYFRTHHRVNRSHRSIPLCKISGETMAKCFDFTDAQKLIRQDDARRLHHLAMLQGKDLHIIDNDKLSNSWNEYDISLHVPGDLIERPYDDTLLTLQDSSSTSSREASDQPKEKSHLSSKSQAKSNDTLQVAKTSPKSKTLKDRDMSGKSKLRRVMSSSKTSLASKGCHGSSTTNELHVSLDNGNSQRSKLEIPCDDIFLIYHFIDDNDFVDEDSNLVSLFESAKQLERQKLRTSRSTNTSIPEFLEDLNTLNHFHKETQIIRFMTLPEPTCKSCDSQINSRIRVVAEIFLKIVLIFRSQSHPFVVITGTFIKEQPMRKLLPAELRKKKCRNGKQLKLAISIVQIQALINFFSTKMNHRCSKNSSSVLIVVDTCSDELEGNMGFFVLFLLCGCLLVLTCILCLKEWCY
uniref:Aminotransferase-like plant mobile domain-containing protein n=1 Tax=Solanum lycopersicum TaxID=4081 RepID=A0A3Q7GI52_SOLLC